MFKKILEKAKQHAVALLMSILAMVVGVGVDKEDLTAPPPEIPVSFEAAVAIDQQEEYLVNITVATLQAFPQPGRPAVEVETKENRTLYVKSLREPDTELLALNYLGEGEVLTRLNSVFRIERTAKGLIAGYSPIEVGGKEIPKVVLKKGLPAPPRKKPKEQQPAEGI